MTILLSSLNNLSQRYSYNPTTGIITDIEYNRPITTINGKGEMYIQYLGKRLLVHRVAYYLMTKQEPSIVNHLDNNQSNNKWDNLIHIDRATISRRPTYTKGARYDKRANAYEASAYNGKRISLGLYQDEDTAKRVSEAYRAKHYYNQAYDVSSITTISGRLADSYI